MDHEFKERLKEVYRRDTQLEKELSVMLAALVAEKVRKAEKEGNISYPAYLPLSDDRFVSSSEATPDQWENATDGAVEDALLAIFRVVEMMAARTLLIKRQTGPRAKRRGSAS
jgi:hypothetical protein